MKQPGGLAAHAKGEGISKIFFGLIEEEEMGSPGNIANDADPRLAQCFIPHSALLVLTRSMGRFDGNPTAIGGEIL